MEAAVRSGRQQEAAAHAPAMREAGLTVLSPRLELLAAVAAALAAPADQAVALFTRALATEGAERWPFDRARVQLALGGHLRRARAANEAQVHLETAGTAFRALGARPRTDRAAGELPATKRPAGPAASPAVALTAQEHQIAAVAAGGLTSKQIGQRLFLSPRTVGGHLYRVFPKLGVASRAGRRGALNAVDSRAAA